MSRILVCLVLIGLTVGVATAMASDFHDAVEAGDLARVEVLLKADPALASQPLEGSQYNDLPLHIAARHGHVGVAKALLDADADIDGGDSDTSTALDVAAMNRQPEMVAFLVTAGADINHRDNNGAYSLSFALSAGDSACVHTLMDAGVDMENISLAGDNTLLHVAARSGFDWVTGPLVEAGADVNSRNGAGQTPLYWAAAGAHPEMVVWFIEHGADPDAGSDSGWSSVGMAAARGDNETLKLLIDAGCGVNARQRGGATALQHAARKGDKKAVKMLLGAGARPNMAEDNLGRTPLHLAAVRGYADVSTILAGHGAYSDARDFQGATAIQLASHHGQTGVVAALAEASGEKVNTGKTCQKTAACAQGKGMACNAASLAAQPRPAKGEAVAWYCGHSGWAVLTHDHVLVFDYWERDRQPDEPGLAAGCICPDELAGRDVVVFVSHDHGDHWWPGVMEWRSKVENTTYVFGFEAENVEGYESVVPREHYDFDGVEVTTTRSTDAGVGFVVKVDGVTIFHPGDHHNRAPELDGMYREDIDWLAAAGVRPDLMFLPVSGCGFGDLEPVHAGANYTLETLRPAVFSPMHGGQNSRRYHDFVAERKELYPDIEMIAVTDRGDRIFVGGQVVSAR